MNWERAEEIKKELDKSDESHLLLNDKSLLLMMVDEEDAIQYLGLAITLLQNELDIRLKKKHGRP